jgi:hypothetical protein
MLVKAAREEWAAAVAVVALAVLEALLALAAQVRRATPAQAEELARRQPTAVAAQAEIILALLGVLVALVALTGQPAVMVAVARCQLVTARAEALARVVER